MLRRRSPGGGRRARPRRRQLSYRSVESILQHRLDETCARLADAADPVHHDNIRGPGAARLMGRTAASKDADAGAAMPPAVSASVTDKLSVAQLEQSLWSAADFLRGSIDSSDYKTYIFRCQTATTRAANQQRFCAGSHSAASWSTFS